MWELSEPEQPDDLRGLRILLVEDSPVVADALKQHLELLGAAVAGPAATTAEAREVILGGRPDVALVDFPSIAFGLLAAVAEHEREAISERHVKHCDKIGALVLRHHWATQTAGLRYGQSD
jgi:DNA-binding NarL/FixJ family response regulator